jgi:hypothetical protein
MIFTALFSVGIFITVIVAFSSLPSLQNDLTNTQCSLFYSLDIAINGDQTNEWGGFSQIQSQVGNISSLLSSAASLINSTFGNNNWLLSSMA